MSEKSVGQLGEDQLIDQLLAPLSISKTVIAGPGRDDCAIVELADQADHYQLLKTDSLVESVHFLPGTNPVAVGRKALCRAISDIAATGGSPEYALVTLAVDSDRLVSEIEGWYRGIYQTANEFGGIDIVGGETTSLPTNGALISIALTGRVGKDNYLARTGAEPGDTLYVTGHLGGSFASGRHLDFEPRLEQGQWLAANKSSLQIHSMMDLSDGLAKDLPRLADQSGQLGYQLDLEKIPIHTDADIESALGEGEDYELLFSGKGDGVTGAWQQQFPELALTAIGTLSEPEGARTELTGGWEHFA